MKEIFNKLLESNVLTEETVGVLESAITEAINEAVETARQEAIIEAKASVAKTWETERTALIEAIDSQITTAVTSSVAELNEAKEQLETMKVDLSKRYIQREHQLAESVKTELDSLVGDLDAFMKQVVEAHMSTVTDDLKAIKEDNFGRAIFKAFASEFVNKQYGTAEMKAVTESAKLAEAKLTKALEENASLRARVSDATRQNKMKELLAPLAGEKRKVMEAVLANVPTAKLEEHYRSMLPRVLKDSEKEVQVLAESKKTASAKPARVVVPRGEVKTGDGTKLPTRSSPEQLNENADDSMTRQLQRLAGIKQH